MRVMAREIPGPEGDLEQPVITVLVRLDLVHVPDTAARSNPNAVLRVKARPHTHSVAPAAGHTSVAVCEMSVRSLPDANRQP
jgi:hypothetical protein